MEFLAGIIFVLLIAFIGYRVYQARKRKRTLREQYIPPRKSGFDREIK